MTPPLRSLLWNTLVQPHFDYAYSTWYPNITNKLKHRIQTTEKKCLRFCLQLNKLKHILHEEFERLNWLLVTYNLNNLPFPAFKYFKDQCYNYVNEVFDVTTEGNFQLRGSFQKL